MIIKWYKNMLIYKNREIRFNEEIITSKFFKKWLVVALPHKLYFLCNDEIIIPVNILSIDITSSYILYQNNIDNNIYKITHPFSIEEFIFSCQDYKFKFLHEQEIYVLEREGRHFIKHKEKIYQIVLEENYKLILITKSYQDSKIFRILKYEKYLILIYENTFTFLEYQNEKFIFTNPIFLKEQVFITKILRMNLKTKFVYFLQINNLLVYANKFIYKFDFLHNQNALKKKKFQSNEEIIFWKKPDKLEKKILESLDYNDFLEVTNSCISTKKYDFVRIDLDFSKLDFILEKEFLKSKSILDFYKKFKKYDFLENSRFYEKLNILFSYKTEILENPDFKTLLEISYNRIFNYNEKFDFKFTNDKNRLVLQDKMKSNADKFNYNELVTLKIRDNFNLAYTLIFYEKNRKVFFKGLKKLNFFSFFKKFLGDERMREIINLFFEPIRIFELDDNDGEDVAERNYVLRLSSNIGKSYCFYNNNFHIKEHKLDTQDIFKSLNFPLIKNGVTSFIELKDKTWKNWPSFNFGVHKILSCKKKQNYKLILQDKSSDEFIKAGLIFGLGLKKYFRKMDYKNILENINEDKEIILISSMISFSISNEGTRNSEFEEFCYKKYFTDQSLNIKLGALSALSNIFSFSKNIKLENILKLEIDKIGIYKSDKHNKNHNVVYDTTHNIICTINLVKIIGENMKFINLKNRLCELILNGICLKDKSKFKNKFERFKGDPLDEIFYGNMFLEEISGNNFESRISEIEKFYKNFTIWEVYKYSGIIFYYGINEKHDLKSRDLELLLKIETQENKGFRILFDYLLITFCLFKSSTCNLDLLKIIRRQIKRTELISTNEDKNNFCFTNSGIKKDKIGNLIFGDIEKYKICLGILCLGLSKYKIKESKSKKLSLISTFFINWPMSPHDQGFYNFFRYELIRNLEKKNNKNLKIFRFTKYFKKRFNELNEKDKKYVIDVISDYYESYHNKEDYFIDINYIKDLIIRST
ncbi:putative anaphase-promoting complex subunit 1 (APC1) [Vairimorpha necatrix]|uniref:Anaphase-promoting complex subunit 1 (APC1) n=1 Tax=Vairimorpha necatrix TaxID=6039 RepID=A0AAX4JE22_9MICR